MMILTVTVPEPQIFDAYWYGYGSLVSTVQEENGGWTYQVNYGDDKYRGESQAARFASGLYWAVFTAI